MNGGESVFRRMLATIGGAIGAILLGAVWLVLLVLIALQLYVLSTNELAVPGIVLEQLEQRLAESGLRARFSGTSLDPSGRILIENVRISLPDFPEPIVTARAVYVRLNPWLLPVGRIEPREIRIINASAAVPAMLAGSGAPEELVRHLDATLTLADGELGIEQLSARVANVVFSARGMIPLPRRGPETNPRALADFLQQRFPGYCRQAVAAARQLEQFEQPVLNIELTPSESGVPAANVRFLARHLHLAQPVALEAAMVEASTRVLFLDDATVSRLDVSADEVGIPSQATLQRVRAVIFGRLRPGDHEAEPRSIEATADSLTAFGFSARALSAAVFPRPLPRADATVTLQLAGEPLAVQADADFASRHAQLHFHGPISPGLLIPLSERLHVDIRKYFDFGALECAAAEVRLGDGWKFEEGRAQVALTRINADGVLMDWGRATVEFDGRRFHSPDAFARLGPNFAFGSYEQDLHTLDYRFLLHGRLQPMEISPWFPSGWWADFFRQFAFPASPPNASVDVVGRWKTSEHTSVFVFADAAKPVLRRVAFDQVRTRLFIRPAYFDGLEVLTRRGAGTASGTFTLRLNHATHDWERFDLKMDSTYDLGLIAQAIQPLGAGLFTAFEITGAPELRIAARFDGPGASGGEHQNVRVEARTAGEFRYHQFPLQDVSFTAMVEDGNVTIDQFEARFGGGAATAHARLSGPAGQQQLGFDVNLKNAHLGEVAAALEQFFAHQQGRAPGIPGKFVQQKANVRLDLGASAEGRYADPFSFKGGGNAVLQGAEIGELPLLGALSELFTFTALRFTSLRANFKIEGNKLLFPEVALRGDNSAVDAHGEYLLERRELDFNAKVFPFQESGNLIKSVVGAVLTPLSNVLEVKLKGTLQKPHWAFVLGPSNFLRSLAPEAHGAGATPGLKPPSPAPAVAPLPPATTPADSGRPPPSGTQ